MARCVSIYRICRFLFLSLERYKREREEKKETEVQTKKQHTTQQFPTLPAMTTLRSTTNEYTHLSIPTAYIIEWSNTITRLHFFTLLDDFFFFFLVPETTSNSLVAFASIDTHIYIHIYIYINAHACMHTYIYTKRTNEAIHHYQWLY